MKKLLALFAAAALFVPGAGGYAEDGVTVPGVKLEKVSGEFKFTEGPACDAKGNVYFTDQPNDRIMLWSTDGKITTFMQPCGRSNGLCIDKEGRLWACADENNELWVIDVKTKKHEVAVKDYQGKLLNAPNDVWVAPDGGVFFSDPMYPRDYWKRDPAIQVGGEFVYYLSPDRKTLKKLDTGLTKPNGIIGTPDGKTLYVADIDAQKTYSFAIKDGGELAGKKLFCEQGSDGVTLDKEGNLYLTGRGVTVYDKTGKKIQQIDVPEGWTANVCFGGKDRDTLFITASRGLYSIKTRVRGAGSQ